MLITRPLKLCEIDKIRDLSWTSSLGPVQHKRNAAVLLSWPVQTIFNRLLKGWTTLDSKQIAEIESLCDPKKAETWKRELENLVEEEENQHSEDGEQVDKCADGSERGRILAELGEANPDIEILPCPRKIRPEKRKVSPDSESYIEVLKPRVDFDRSSIRPRSKKGRDSHVQLRKLRRHPSPPTSSDESSSDSSSSSSSLSYEPVDTSRRRRRNIHPSPRRQHQDTSREPRSHQKTRSTFRSRSPVAQNSGKRDRHANKSTSWKHRKYSTPPTNCDESSDSSSCEFVHTSSRRRRNKHSNHSRQYRDTVPEPRSQQKTRFRPRSRSRSPDAYSSFKRPGAPTRSNYTRYPASRSRSRSPPRNKTPKPEPVIVHIHNSTNSTQRSAGPGSSLSTDPAQSLSQGPYAPGRSSYAEDELYPRIRSSRYPQGTLSNYPDTIPEYTPESGYIPSTASSRRSQFNIRSQSNSAYTDGSEIHDYELYGRPQAGTTSRRSDHLNPIERLKRERENFKQRVSISAGRTVPLQRNTPHSYLGPFEERFPFQRDDYNVSHPPLTSQQEHAQYEAPRQRQYADAQDYMKSRHGRADDPDSRYRLSNERLDIFRKQEEEGKGTDRREQPSSGSLHIDRSDRRDVYHAEASGSQRPSQPHPREPEPPKIVARLPNGPLRRRVTMEDLSDEETHRKDFHKTTSISDEEFGGLADSVSQSNSIHPTVEPAESSEFQNDPTTELCTDLVKYAPRNPIPVEVVNSEEKCDDAGRKSRHQNQATEESNDGVDGDDNFSPTVVPVELWKCEPPEEPSLADGIRNGTWLPLYVRATGESISLSTRCSTDKPQITRRDGFTVAY